MHVVSWCISAILSPRATDLPCFTPQEACGIDPKNTVNFGEEVVRGQPVFVLSVLLQNLEPLLRKTAELGNWQVGPFPGTPPAVPHCACWKLPWQIAEME